ncbi:MAG: ribose-phosphate diphosphokinase [Gammaproteobacteria bacterium]|nr:ribose-phosphate diphosphokinase [Gammaproteobacteria bacterium]
MPFSSADSLVLAFPGYAEPAQRLAQAAACPYAEISIHRFPDGESRVQLPPALPAHVVIYCTLDHPNEKLVELELAAATALTLGASALTLVAPYLAYMRQDIAFEPGQAISQQVIGRWLARRFEHVITVDPHLHRVHDLREVIPGRQATALSAAPVMSAWLQAHAPTAMLLGPDEESAQWVSAIAAPARLQFGVASKQRFGDRDVAVRLPDMEFTDRHVVLVDDMVSTGHTIEAAASQLKTLSAADITVLVTHALFVDDAEQRMHAAGVGRICSTDSVLHPTNGIELAALLATAL